MTIVSITYTITCGTVVAVPLCEIKYHAGMLVAGGGSVWSNRFVQELYVSCTAAAYAHIMPMPSLTQINYHA